MKPLRVISISRRTRLLSARNDALAVAGFAVVSPRAPEEALLLLQGPEKAEAIVIGDSVEAPLRQEIIEAARQLVPGIVVYYVYAAPDAEPEPAADHAIDATEGAEAVARALIQRFARSRYAS